MPNMNKHTPASTKAALAPTVTDTGGFLYLAADGYRTNSEVHLARDLLDGHTSLAFG
jgi:hypothetical protein